MQATFLLRTFSRWLAVQMPLHLILLFCPLARHVTDIASWVGVCWLALGEVGWWLMQELQIMTLSWVLVHERHWGEKWQNRWDRRAELRNSIGDGRKTLLILGRSCMAGSLEGFGLEVHGDLYTVSVASVSHLSLSVSPSALPCLTKDLGMKKKSWNYKWLTYMYSLMAVTSQCVW